MNKLSNYGPKSLSLVNRSFNIGILNKIKTTHFDKK